MLILCYHQPMLENLFGVARLALIDPQVVCAIAIDEVVVQRCFRPQSFDALPQTLFIGGKEYRVHELEIGFYYLVRIGAEDVFNRYLHIVVLFGGYTCYAAIRLRI